VRAKPRRTLKTQLRETARAAILDACEELAAAKGLQAVTLTQIAELAGVAVGTLYNYFTDREDLVRALFEARRATLRPMLKAAGSRADGKSFAVRTLAFVEDMLTALDAHRRYIKVALESEHAKQPGAHANPDLIAIAVALIDAGIEEKAVDRTLRDVLPWMLVGAIKGVVMRRVNTDTPFAADAPAIAAVFLDGARGARL
jgi:AcrR family transcriptional regulator